MAIIDDLIVAATALKKAQDELVIAQTNKVELVKSRATLTQQIADTDTAIAAKQVAVQQAKDAIKALLPQL